MNRQEMLAQMNEAIVLLGETAIPAKYAADIGSAVYAALRRICAVAEALKESGEEEHADDHDQQG